MVAEPSESKPTLGGPLGFLQPRETRRIQKARAPRPMSAWLRRGLPALAVLLLIALILWPIINPNKVAHAILQNIPDIVVQNPHYSGVDTKGQPYSLAATTATRPGGSQNIYDLVAPSGEMTLKSGNWLSGKAAFGRFDQDTRRLWLGGDVQLFHDNGYEFTTDDAQIDIDGDFAWGDRPVLIQGGFGEIRGQGFKLLDDGNTMIVKGPAKAILSLQGGGSSDKPGPSTK